MPATTDRSQFSRQERLRFVESVVLWEGLVKRQRVRDVFGIALNHVTRDLAFYQEQNPDGLDFRPELRGYVAGPRFKPVYASDDPTDYLSLLQTRAETGDVAILPWLGREDVQIGTLPSPALGIDKRVLRDVLLALRHGTAVKVLYHAMNADRARERTLWPHALINTGLRWYVRTYDGESGQFRSLVLARMERSIRVAEPSPEKPQRDIGWTQLVTAQVVPQSTLNAHQRAVVAREFGMRREGKECVWAVRLRQCLVGPFARRYGLDAEPKASRPGQWVVLRNHAELKPFFWPVGGE